MWFIIFNKLNSVRVCFYYSYCVIFLILAMVYDYASCSLRNNMFELADRLVGIYKTDNCTKSITINPGSFVVCEKAAWWNCQRFVDDILKNASIISLLTRLIFHVILIVTNLFVFYVVYKIMACLTFYCTID